MKDAVSDFIDWEPGYSVICVLCNRERGGGDPPGPWMRHRPSQRRRIPIFDACDGRNPMGYLEYIHD
jgi:hypothetical protein